MLWCWLGILMRRFVRISSLHRSIIQVRFFVGSRKDSLRDARSVRPTVRLLTWRLGYGDEESRFQGCGKLVLPLLQKPGSWWKRRLSGPRELSLRKSSSDSAVPKLGLETLEALLERD